MLENDIIASLRQLVVAVIISIITGKPECVALDHLHMTERLKGVRSLIEMSAVTVEVGTVMTEMHIPVEHLGIVITILVIVQVVSMDEIDPLVLHLLTWSTLLGWRHGKHHAQHNQTYYDRQEPLQLLSFNS